MAEEGFQGFFAKNFPSVSLPSATTSSCSALDDIYRAVYDAVKIKLADVKSLCLMFDGWTDKYRSRPYMGIRASFLDDWKYQVVTLGSHVIVGHTAHNIADHLNGVLKVFSSDPKRLYLSSCHDGAANMIKTCQLLKVDAYQHYTAHALHLLLTTDALNKVDEVKEIIQKCRDIVTTLHFKRFLIEDEQAATEDKIMIESMQTKIAEVSDLLDLDNQFAVEDEQEDETDKVKKHLSLKASCPTWWNSILTMIYSIVQLQREVQNTLKKTGNRDLCLHGDDLDFLRELVDFLRPLQSFTDLLSSHTPALAAIPLMKTQIRKLCTSFKPNEDERLCLLKQAILDNLDRRFPVTEAIKLHQIIDPDTKGIVPQKETTEITQKAVASGIKRGVIVLLPECDDKATDGQPQAKLRKMKL